MSEPAPGASTNVLEPRVLSYERQAPPVKARPRTLVLLLVLLLEMVVLAAGLMSEVISIHVWTAYAAGRSWSTSEADMGGVLAEAVYHSFFPGVLVIAVCLVFWMYRTHAQLRRAGAPSMRLHSANAFLGWILPYKCFIRPYEVMREIYAGSHRESLRVFRPLVGVWWALWIGTGMVGLFGQLALRSQKAEPTEAAIAFSVLGAVVYGLYTVDALLLFLIVYRVDRAERRPVSFKGSYATSPVRE